MVYAKIYQRCDGGNSSAVMENAIRVRYKKKQHLSNEQLVSL